MNMILLARAAGFSLLSISPTWAQEQVTITVWTWASDLDKEVAVYEQENPGINIELVNAGAGPAEYEKVRNALRAGSGAPDVFFVAGSAVRSFVDSDALLDLNEYGAAEVKDVTLPFAWDVGTIDGGQYFIPAGFGPMTFFYRADVLEQHGIEVPKTWDEFAEAAEALKAADSSLRLASFPTLDVNLDAIFWQAGHETFEVDGTNVKIDWTGDTAQKVAAYWQDLLDRDLISRSSELGTEWTQEVATGKLVGMIGGAWYPLILMPAAPDQAGLWRGTTLPQWTAGENASADGGLAGYAVTKQSENPQEATDFVVWLTSSEVSQKMHHEIQSQLPSFLPVLESDWLLDKKHEFFGGQEISKVYLESAEGILQHQFSPFHDYVLGQLLEQGGRVAQNVVTLPQALTELQRSFEIYAEDQGYTVVR